MVDFKTAAKKSATKKSGGSTAMQKWDEKFSQYAKQSTEQLQNIGTGGIGVSFGRDKISVGDKEIKGGRLECIIIGSCAHNRWFKKEFNAKATTPPDCYAFAVVSDDPEMAPHPQAVDKQSEKCADCAQNVFGTARVGRGKACGNTIRLGIITAADAEEASEIPTAEMATGGVSPTNLKHYKKYVEMLDEEYHRPPWAVVTEISSHDDSETQIRLEFKFVSLIKDNDTLLALEKRFLNVQQVLQQPYAAVKDGAGATKASGTGKSSKFSGAAAKKAGKK